MKHRSTPFAVLVLAPIALFACASVESAIARDPEQLRDWDQVMHQVIDPLFEDALRPQSRLEPTAMDLALVAGAADHSARAMALGHGRLERKEIKDFAHMAREAESWFREIEAAARAGQRERVRDLVRSGERQHCERCHDAANK